MAGPGQGKRACHTAGQVDGIDHLLVEHHTTLVQFHHPVDQGGHLVQSVA